MIQPTIGRVVWFYKGDGSLEPEAAIVAYVWGAECVNLAVFDANGNSRGETSVTLYQGEGERPQSRFAEWMPYQVGQAKRHEAEKASAA